MLCEQLREGCTSLKTSPLALPTCIQNSTIGDIPLSQTITCGGDGDSNSSGDNGGGRGDGFSDRLVSNMGQGERQALQGVLEMNLLLFHNFLEELKQEFCTTTWRTPSGRSSLSSWYIHARA